MEAYVSQNGYDGYVSLIPDRSPPNTLTKVRVVLKVQVARETTKPNQQPHCEVEGQFDQLSHPLIFWATIYIYTYLLYKGKSPTPPHNLNMPFNIGLSQPRATSIGQNHYVRGTNAALSLLYYLEALGQNRTAVPNLMVDFSGAVLPKSYNLGIFGPVGKEEHGRQKPATRIQ